MAIFFLPVDVPILIIWKNPFVVTIVNIFTFPVFRIKLGVMQANSVNSDQMLQFVVPELGLYYLQMSGSKRG